jgi:hypothetical protein
MSMQASDDPMLSAPKPAASPVAKPAAKPVATWRKVVAGILDTLCVFFIAGFAVGYLTGGITPDGHGFELKGMPALIVLFTVGAYFAIFTKFLGGTVWQRLLRVR